LWQNILQIAAKPLQIAGYCRKNHVKKDIEDLKKLSEKILAAWRVQFASLLLQFASFLLQF